VLLDRVAARLRVRGLSFHSDADLDDAVRQALQGLIQRFGLVPMSAFGGKADIARTCPNVRF